MPLPLTAIKIVSKHKVVCVKNLMSDPRLLYQQYNVFGKQKELTDEFEAEVIQFYPFPRCFQKVQNLLTKISNFPTPCHRNVPPPPPPPPPPNAEFTQNLRLLWAKLICGLP